MFEGSELRFLVTVVIFITMICSACDTIWRITSHGLSHNYTSTAVSTLCNISLINAYCLQGTHILLPLLPCLLLVINWIVYTYWSTISQSYCSLFLMVFSLPLIELTINLVVRRSCDHSSILSYRYRLLVVHKVISHLMLPW